MIWFDFGPIRTSGSIVSTLTLHSLTGTLKGPGSFNRQTVFVLQCTEKLSFGVSGFILKRILNRQTVFVLVLGVGLGMTPSIGQTNTYGGFSLGGKDTSVIKKKTIFF